MSILNNVAWVASRLIAHNGGPFSRMLYSASTIYTRTYKNQNYDMKTNGEYYVSSRLSPLGIKTVFDVGANKGNYTEACLSKFKDARVHAFEIMPQTYKKLLDNISSSRVKMNNFGLSNANGSVEISYNPDDDGVSSLIEGSEIHRGFWEKLSVSVITGDDYCRTNSVSHVDLLKVDVEGAEHLVLDSFRESFERGAISAVQFEFGMVNIYSKFLLRDFWALFSKYGFVLGPVMPRGVDFKDYSVHDEDFQGPPNFFAVHKSRADVVESVRIRK